MLFQNTCHLFSHGNPKHPKRKYRFMPKIKWVGIIHLTQGFTIGAFYSGNSPSMCKMVFAFKILILTIFWKPIYCTKQGTPIVQMDLGWASHIPFPGPGSPHISLSSVLCKLPAKVRSMTLSGSQHQVTGWAELHSLGPLMPTALGADPRLLSSLLSQPLCPLPLHPTSTGFSLKVVEVVSLLFFKLEVIVFQIQTISHLEDTENTKENEQLFTKHP